MTDQAARAGIARRLTQLIDTLTPCVPCGTRIDAHATRELLALLVACRAELGGAPSLVIDLPKSQYSVGGVS